MIDQTALQQYAIVMNYFAQEKRAFVGRTNLFLIANAGMAGFVSNALARLSPNDAWSALAQPATLCIAGLAVTWLWSRAISMGTFWLEHYREILKKLEPTAFGEVNVLRGKEPKEEESAEAKRIARASLKLFAILWVIALTNCAVILIIKLNRY